MFSAPCARQGSGPCDLFQRGSGAFPSFPARPRAPRVRAIPLRVETPSEMMLTHSLAIPVVHKARLAGSRSSAAVRPVARRSFQVYARVTKTNRPPKPMDKLPPPEEEEGLSAVETAAMVSGLVAVPVTLWSLFTLKTTGERSERASGSGYHPGSSTNSDSCATE